MKANNTTAMREALKYMLQFDATDEAAEEDGLTDAERISSFGEITAWSVRCRNMSCPCHLYANWYPTQEAAVNDWNRRMEKERKQPRRRSLFSRLFRKGDNHA